MLVLDGFHGDAVSACERWPFIVFRAYAMSSIPFVKRETSHFHVLALLLTLRTAPGLLQHCFKDYADIAHVDWFMLRLILCKSDSEKHVLCDLLCEM